MNNGHFEQQKLQLNTGTKYRSLLIDFYRATQLLARSWEIAKKVQLCRLRRYKRKSVEVGVFRRGVDHFERKFQTEGSVAYQPLLVCPFVWYQKFRSVLH